MSSQVNKSNVRFKPRAGRRNRLDSTTRRNSTTTGPTGFSAADVVKAKASESAIVDDDFRVPTVTEKPEIAAPSLEKSAANASVEADEPLIVKDFTTVAPTEPQTPAKVPPPAVAAQLVPAPSAVVPAPAPAPPRPTTNFDLEESEQEEDNNLYIDPGVIGKVPQPVKPIGSALIVEDDNDSDREVNYDEAGRVVMDPKDLVRLGRTNAKVHFDNRVINAESFTMSALCSDIPIGVKNDEYSQWEAGRSLRKRERTQLLLAKRMVRGQYMPKKESKKFELLRIYKDWQEKRENEFGTGRDGQVDIDNDDFGGAESQAQQAPTLTIDATGNIQLDERSTQVDRHRDNRADDDSGKTAKEANDKYNKLVNSASHRTKERPERWTPEETAVFYDSLSAWGTDFNLIAQFFPQRTRGQIKTKFKYEEKRNPEKVHMYLVHRKRVSLKDVTRVSGKPIIDIDEIEADLEAVRQEHAAQLEKEQQARTDAEREDAARKAELHSRKRQKKGITGSSEVVGEVGKKEEEEEFDEDSD